MSDIVFLSGKRTPFGTFLGSLSSVSALDLGVVASNAAIEQAGISATDIDHVIFGNVLQTSGLVGDHDRRLEDTVFQIDWWHVNRSSEGTMFNMNRWGRAYCFDWGAEVDLIKQTFELYV